MKSKNLTEMFGEPIGSYAGEPAAGVRDSMETCSECGMMPLDLESTENCGCGAHESPEEELCSACGMPVSQCSCQDSNVCPLCGMMNLDLDGACSCGGMNEAKKKRKGPSKKAAQKILKGTKSFAEKMKKVSGWAEEPAAAAAWMQHKATGKWPREK